LFLKIISHNRKTQNPVATLKIINWKKKFIFTGSTKKNSQRPVTFFSHSWYGKVLMNPEGSVLSHPLPLMKLAIPACALYPRPISTMRGPPVSP
jgi:hypothetical protein